MRRVSWRTATTWQRKAHEDASVRVDALARLARRGGEEGDGGSNGQSYSALCG